MAPFEDSAGSSGQPDENVSGPYDEMSRVLAGLPRPRPVRITRRGKMNATVITTALVVSMAVFVAGLVTTSRAAGQKAIPPGFFSYALPIILVVVVILVLMRTIQQQKVLLAEGEMATARVTKRWIARNGPNIRYEFTTPLGEHFSRSTADASRTLSVGMNVPVFYDSQRPKRQLALCASFYEVILPGEM
jgi:hypothetical protein